MEQTKCYVIDLKKIRQSTFKKMFKHGTILKVSGITFILLAGLPDVSFASVSGIDPQANQLYKKLLGVGKWVIIFKGGLDTIKGITDNDMHAAKKSFLGYLLTYIILSGLPWCLNEVDKMFTGMGEEQ